MPVRVVVPSEDGLIALLRPRGIVIAMSGAEFESFSESNGVHGNRHD
jgi:hypothetical protein